MMGYIESLRSHEKSKLFDARADTPSDACTSSDFVNEFHSVYLATHSEIKWAGDRDVLLGFKSFKFWLEILIRIVDFKSSK